MTYPAKMKNKSKSYYFDVVRNTPTRFQRFIKTKNGKIIWSSEGATTKHNALKPVMQMVRAIGVRKCRVTYHDLTKNKKEVIV